MEKVFEMNPEMVKLMSQKSMYNRPKLSRKEQEHLRDSSMEFVNLGDLHYPYIVKVHRNRMDFIAHIRGCAYNLGKYRYAEEPRKSKEVTMSDYELINLTLDQIRRIAGAIEQVRVEQWHLLTS